MDAEEPLEAPTVGSGGSSKEEEGLGVVVEPQIIEIPPEEARLVRAGK